MRARPLLLRPFGLSVAQQDRKKKKNAHRFEASHLRQQDKVDMYEPCVLAGPGLDTVARFVVEVLVTRILRTVYIHFQGTSEIIVPAASEAESFCDELFKLS